MTEMAFGLSDSLSLLRVDQNLCQDADRAQPLLACPARTNLLEL